MFSSSWIIKDDPWQMNKIGYFPLSTCICDPLPRLKAAWGVTGCRWRERYASSRGKNQFLFLSLYFNLHLHLSCWAVVWQGGSSGRYASSGSGRNQFLEQHGFTRKWKHGGSGPSEAHNVRQLLQLYRGEDACQQSSDSLEQRWPEGEGCQK